MNIPRAFLLAVCAALLAIPLVTIGLVAWQDAALSASSARDRLDSLRMAQDLVERQRNEDLATRAELIAGNQAVVGYIVHAFGDALPGAELDRASIVDLLQERRDQVGLALLAVLDGQGQLVVTTERFSTTTDLSQVPLFQQARQTRAISKGLWRDEARLLHVAILPMAAYGLSEIYLLVALPVNQALAQSIAQVAAADVAFVADTADGPLVAVSTLAPARQQTLLGALSSAAPGDALRFRHDGERQYATAAPLFGSGEARLVAVVAPDLDAPMARTLRLPLAVGALAALAAALLAAWWMWARWIGPAQRLATIIEQTADTVDLHRHAPEAGAPPLARIAAALNRLLQRLQADRQGPLGDDRTR